MSLSPAETQALKARFVNLIDLIAAHNKFVDTFLVPIAQKGIDDGRYAREDVIRPYPGAHPGIPGIEDAGMALAREKEGIAMLNEYQTQRQSLESLRQTIASSLNNPLFMIGPNSKKSADATQSHITKICRNYAQNLVGRFKTDTSKASVTEKKFSVEALRIWCDDELEDQEAYIQSALRWSREKSEEGETE